MTKKKAMRSEVSDLSIDWLTPAAVQCSTTRTYQKLRALKLSSTAPTEISHETCQMLHVGLSRAQSVQNTLCTSPTLLVTLEHSLRAQVQCTL